MDRFIFFIQARNGLKRNRVRSPSISIIKDMPVSVTGMVNDFYTNVEIYYPEMENDPDREIWIVKDNFKRTELTAVQNVFHDL